jgi:phage gpG-like protein
MQFRFTISRNQISPALVKHLRAATDARPALNAAGEVLVQMAKRSFDEPALRPAVWPPLKASTLSQKAKAGKSNGILKSSGTLWRSLRVISAEPTRVTIGSDRPYAGFHQLGTQHIPARPFFPFAQGKLTAAGKVRVEAALRIKLGIK